MKLSGRILITGGAGTLGRAIVTRALEDDWDAEFTIYSRGEALQAAMRGRFPSLRYVLGDVRDYARLEAAVTGHDVVIHAAAMKRIPESEAQPYECFQTNIVGSQNVARAALNARVRIVVGISTDKACRATTMYGASKLALEKIFRAQTPLEGSKFVLVRYGNVVASRGSVIPLWRAQAARGEPLGITHATMTRFWMSPFEAVDLVVQAALTLAHGEVLVKKMKSLSITALAGIIVPGAPHRIIGLRSEEKVHEDLVHRDEPCVDSAEQAILSPEGLARITYNSECAPRLSVDEFESMYADAERLEA